MKNIKLLKNKQIYLLQKWTKAKWDSIPLIDRWLFGEIIPPILFGISAFTILSLSLGEALDLIRQIISSNLPPIKAIEVLIFRMPEYLVISFPMATLLGCLIAFSKLSSNSEIKALHSLGISRRRIISAAMIIGSIMTIITFIFNISLVPYGNSRAFLGLNDGLNYEQTQDDITYSEFNQSQNLKTLFYAKTYQFKDKSMNDITIVDFADKNQNNLIVAKKGFWNKADNNLKLIDGSISFINSGVNSNIINFQEYYYSLSHAPFDIAKLPKNSNDMTLNQAISARNLYKLSGNRKEERRLRVRIQEKVTIPLSCLVFSIIGTSLAIRSSKIRGKGDFLSFGISIVLIFFYYTISFIFSAFGVSGILNPIIAAWIPIGLFVISSEYLIRESN